MNFDCKISFMPQVTQQREDFLAFGARGGAPVCSPNGPGLAVTWRHLVVGEHQRAGSRGLVAAGGVCLAPPRSDVKWCGPY